MISSVLARRAASAAVVTVLSLAAVVATAASASAESRTLKDGRGDTWQIFGTEPARKPGHPEADVRKVVVKHTARKVVVRARVQDLRREGQAITLAVDIDTPSDVTYSASADAWRGSWKGTTTFFAGDSRTCEPRHSLSYGKDVIRLSVPTRCLARPAWVRAQVKVIHVTGRGRAFFDNAHNRQLQGEFTRRIRRG